MKVVGDSKFTVVIETSNQDEIEFSEYGDYIQNGLKNGEKPVCRKMVDNYKTSKVSKDLREERQKKEKIDKELRRKEKP